MNITIISESQAIIQIHNALDCLDLDDLSQVVSMIATDEMVVVVPDGTEHEDVVSLGQSDDAMSDVFQHGESKGYIDEHGKVMEFGHRYEAQKSCDETDHGTFVAHMNNKDLMPILDNATGEIVAYVKADQVDLFLRKLEAY